MSEAMETTKDIYTFAKRLAVFGGEYACEKHQNAIVDFKNGDPRDVVTNIDTEIDAEIQKKISERYPEHGFYSEESGTLNNRDSKSWAIDPIDGTSNYARGIPHYACCVSYLENNEVKAGAVYNPITRECFTYNQGRAFLNDTEISVSSTTSLKNAYVIFHPGRKPEMNEWAGESIRKLLKNAQKNINLASAALDLCFLASGKVDVVIYGTLTTLDVAGAIAMVRSAGGEVYTYDTKTPVSFIKEPQRIIATATPELLEDYFRQC